MNENLTAMDIVVRGTDITWSLHSAGRSDHVTRDPEKLNLPERRLQTVSLLANLVRHSTDVSRTATNLEKTPGTKGALYTELLNVVGHELFDLLFVGELREEVLDALAAAQQGRIDRVRIALCFVGQYGAWLTALPWEYTRTTPNNLSEGVFLSEHAELLLSRRLELDARNYRPLERRPGAVPVLLVCSSPPNPHEELEGVDAVPVVETLEMLHEEGIVKLDKLIEPAPPEHQGRDWRPTVTWDAFKARVARVQPVIIHFIGHGDFRQGSGELAFADEGTGAEDWKSDEQFARIAIGCRPLRLVLLQSCNSALPDPYVAFSGVAQKLARAGIPAVVGMQYRIASSAANAFAVAFYREFLIEGSRISFAVQAGRRALLERRGDELAFGLPVLYLSEDTAIAPVMDGEPEAPARLPSVARGDVDAAGDRCPRCGATLEGSEPKVCHVCLLRLRCTECGKPFDEPESDRACRRCGATVTQVPYDTAISVSAEAASPARTALAALRGPTGGGAP